MAELPKDEPLVDSAFLFLVQQQKLFISFGKEDKSMTDKLTIGLIGLVAIVFMITGIVTGVTMWPPVIDEQIEQVKDSIKGVPIHEFQQAVETADYDLIKEIEVVKSRGVDLHMEWVKAHQDKSTPVELLPLEAQLNVKADADVTDF